MINQNGFRVFANSAAAKMLTDYIEANGIIDGPSRVILDRLAYKLYLQGVKMGINVAREGAATPLAHVAGLLEMEG